ncbi:uncharacterized protein LOC134271529 [Saccostrea cucullata]|uniref:uncharacterized protein LOC134271529 n=1 Tax=Saccostrea cuccullata TaxID=36930 RepID=UPI002ED1E965
MDPSTSAQDVMRCDLCETAVVQMHCDTCLVNLCKACVGEHISADLSKPHKIVDFKDRKTIPIYPGCTFMIKNAVKCTVSNNQINLNEVLYPTYQDIASDVQNRMSQLEKEFGDLSTAITKHGEAWHREIDKLVQKFKAEVEEMKNTQLQTLQKQLEEINKTMSDIKDEIDSIDLAEDSNNISKLLSITTNVLDRYRNLPQKILPSLSKFNPGTINGAELSKLFGTLSSSSLTLDKHGYSIKTTQKSPEAGSPSPVKQLLDDPETVATINNEYIRLYNVACLSDEEIWTKNRNLDICVSVCGANAVVVVNQAGKLRFRYTGHTPAPKNQSFSPRGITTDSHSHILTADINNECVHIIDQDGQFLRYIDCGLSVPWGLCTDINDNLFVAQLENKVKKIKYLQ